MSSPFCIEHHAAITAEWMHVFLTQWCGPPRTLMERQGYVITLDLLRKGVCLHAFDALVTHCRLWYRPAYQKFIDTFVETQSFRSLLVVLRHLCRHVHLDYKTSVTYNKFRIKLPLFVVYL